MSTSPSLNRDNHTFTSRNKLNLLIWLEMPTRSLFALLSLLALLSLTSRPAFLTMGAMCSIATLPISAWLIGQCWSLRWPPPIDGLVGQLRVTLHFRSFRAAVALGDGSG